MFKTLRQNAISQDSPLILDKINACGWNMKVPVSQLWLEFRIVIEEIVEYTRNAITAHTKHNECETI